MQYITVVTQVNMPMEIMKIMKVSWIAETYWKNFVYNEYCVFMTLNGRRMNTIFILIWIDTSAICIINIGILSYIFSRCVNFVYVAIGKEITLRCVDKIIRNNVMFHCHFPYAFTYNNPWEYDNKISFWMKFPRVNFEFSF